MKRTGYIACLLAMACGSPQDRLADEALRYGAEHYHAAEYLEADSAFALAPEDEHAVRNRGNALFKLKDWTTAITQLRNATTMDSSVAEQAIVRYNLGRAHLAEAMQADTLVRRQREALANMRADATDIATKVNQIVVRDSVQRDVVRLEALIDSSLVQSLDGFRQCLRRDPTDEDARYNFAFAQRLVRQRADREGGDGKDGKDKDQQLSARAERLMHRADSLVEVFKFRDALDLLQLGLKQDPTLKQKKEYMDKLDTVNKAAQAK